jgi:hypothetical protein
MALQQNNGSNVHTFQSEPHAVSSKQKYRDQPARLSDSQGVPPHPSSSLSPPQPPPPSLGSSNIMWDRRVVRGSTYSAQVLPTTVSQDPVNVQKTAERKKLKEMQVLFCFVLQPTSLHRSLTPASRSAARTRRSRLRAPLTLLTVAATWTYKLRLTWRRSAIDQWRRAWPRRRTT